MALIKQRIVFAGYPPQQHINDVVINIRDASNGGVWLSPTLLDKLGDHRELLSKCGTVLIRDYINHIECELILSVALGNRCTIYRYAAGGKLIEDILFDGQSDHVVANRLVRLDTSETTRINLMRWDLQDALKELDMQLGDNSILKHNAIDMLVDLTDIATGQGSYYALNGDHWRVVVFIANRTIADPQSVDVSLDAKYTASIITSRIVEVAPIEEQPETIITAESQPEAVAIIESQSTATEEQPTATEEQ